MSDSEGWWALPSSISSSKTDLLKKIGIASWHLLHCSKYSKIMLKSISISDNLACPCSLSCSCSLCVKWCPQAFAYLKCMFCLKIPEQENKQKTNSNVSSVVWFFFLFEQGVYLNQSISICFNNFRKLISLPRLLLNIWLKFGLQSKRTIFQQHIWGLPFFPNLIICKGNA